MLAPAGAWPYYDGRERMPRPTKRERPFLTAEWRSLVLLNYRADPAVLRPFLPNDTELDTFDGDTLVSLVAFRFLKTRMYGRVAIPFHSNFDEVNLRFYVRREARGELRRGVVFIAEIVPRRAIAVIARFAYNENYSTYPMTRRISRTPDSGEFQYGWSVRQSSYSIEARTMGQPAIPLDSSAEQFITEHYWGYARQRWKHSGISRRTRAVARMEGDECEFFRRRRCALRGAVQKSAERKTAFRFCR